MTQSLRGNLLVAGPGLQDHFRRAVVLLGDHSEEGAVGVVLNRPSDLRVDKAVPSLAGLAGLDGRVFVGGPVRPTDVVLLADLSEPDLADLPVVGTIGFLIGEVAGSAAAAVRRARVFAGYAGWGAGQLERELEESAWIVEPAAPEDVFPGPDDLWREVLRRKGEGYRLLATMPPDPSLN